jgi:Kdo2-lipid IVA lauroyltransferase/acyltransferase
MTVLLYPFFPISRMIGMDAASSLGAFIMRKIGPLLPRTKIARRNISFALPHLREDEVQQIIVEMWDNFGRTLFEFPHVHKLSGAELNERLEIVGLSKTKKYDKAIYISGHFGNWEIACRVNDDSGLKLGVIYRKLNNPFLNRIMTSMRHPSLLQIPKSSQSRQLVKAMTAGYNICLLGDQKFREGSFINFFNKPAKTLSSPIRLAINYRLPIFMVRVVRIKGAYFKLYIDGPFFPKEMFEDGVNDVEFEFMKKMNEIFEAWIKDIPSQWHWIHRRWEKEFYS